MLLNKKRPALLICSTIIGSLLMGCSTTDEPSSNTAETSMGSELLRNGQFASGDDWWVAGAELAVNDSEGCIDIKTPGSNPWDVILGQGGSGLIKGTSYTVEFTARASENTKFMAIVQHEGEPYTKYFSEEIAVTSKSAPFAFTFTHNENSDPKTDFQLQLGAQAAATVCVSNLSLKSN